MRKLIIGASVLLAVIVGGLFYLFSSIDGIVKTVIERVGTQVTGVKVSVGSVAIRVSEGKAAIKGLTVANPPGFSANPAIKFGEVAVSLETTSLNSNPIVIKEILIASPAVALEVSPNGGSNLDVLRRNISGTDQDKTATDGEKPVQSDAAKTEAAKTEPAKGADKKVTIDRLAITGGQVDLAVGGVPGAATTAKIGDIELTGIGRDNGGATPVQVGQEIMNALISGAINSSGSLDGVLGNVADKIKEAVTDEKLKAITGQAGEALKGVLGK
ncbi:DUF748 domain-containing protein [Magnetospirillum molischianum]|uniref:AsmA domain-containing protein n=1 Tax=Magnetospirillum molischianum DSM 120 TaxID=1150626 RepID=H8FNF6_MAGML|nr:hypothetical protein [Magnetospirillum molischianum]CCG39894.1 conserved exported hypothetical protein [Magnetospirillum molischianum DSM 120]